MTKTTFQAFASQKCPRCREGDMFPSKTYNLSHFGKANKNCPNCNLRFEIEPGFFTGAMYFSYGINVVIIAILGIGLNLIFDLDIVVVMGIVITAILLAVPFTFRYSRMMMMYLFSGVAFDSKYTKTMK